MIKASSLYIVIVIALVIGLICSALVLSSLYYKLQFDRTFRYERLEINLSSGVNILLAGSDTAFAEPRTIALFSDSQDSVRLQKMKWGVYTVGMATAFSQQDSLSTVFSIGNKVDSAKWCALYLSDEDRGLEVAFETIIEGPVFLPRAGLTGDQNPQKLRLMGTKTSEKKLPSPDMASLLWLHDQFASRDTGKMFPLSAETDNSYRNPTYQITLEKDASVLAQARLNGNIIIRSDTIITIDSTTSLNNVLVFAPAIIVKDGFRGNCQLFAKDSIRIGKRCEFRYPSAIGVLNLQKGIVKTTPQLYIGEQSTISGLVFTYMESDTDIMPIVCLEKNVRIRGVVYTDGLLKFNGHFEIEGSLFTRRFLSQKDGNYVSNKLFDSTISSIALPRYYLADRLVPVSGSKKNILQWIEK